MYFAVAPYRFSLILFIWLLTTDTPHFFLPFSLLLTKRLDYCVNQFHIKYLSSSYCFQSDLFTKLLPFSILDSLMQIPFWLSSSLRHDSNITTFTHWKYIIQWLRLFTGLCNHHHNLSLEHFHHPKKNPLPICSHSPLPSPPSPRKTICFLPL